MIIIEDFYNPDYSIEITAELSPTDEDFGHNEMRTIYAQLIIESSGNTVNKVSLNIEEASREDKEWLRTAWKNRNKLNIIDDNGDIYNGVVVVGNTFSMSRKWMQDISDIQGNSVEIWTGTLNFES